MLILARKPGQKVVLNDGEIVITLLGEHKGQTRLGFEAPPTVTIHREEVQAHVDAGRPCLLHPTGINMSPIPSDADYRHLSADQRAVRDALTEVAAAIAEQMSETRKLYDNEWRAASAASLERSYHGQNWSMGCVLRVWERHGFVGQPLDNMPPEDIDEIDEAAP